MRLPPMTRDVFKIALVVPQAVPPVQGGAENLWAGLIASLGQLPGVEAELVALPSPEKNLLEVLQSYAQFAGKNLDDYDQVLSTKYPAWAVSHRNHVVYLQHTLRGLYDTYPQGLPTVLSQEILPACHQLLGLPAPVVQALALAGQPLWTASSRAQAEALVFSQYASLGQLAQALVQGLGHVEGDGAVPTVAGLLDFPGPFARACIRLFDAVALSTRAVRRYAAISQTVAARTDYFPADARVQVIHHPTFTSLGVDPATNAGARDLIVTASRLDPPKRLDLLIRAYGQSRVDLPFWIVGTGPAEPQLRALAQQTPGVVLKGYLPESALVAAYRRAVFVPFAPYQEDYGLITVEAFMAGAPVLTTTDAGGPTELVVHGKTGWVAEPTEASIAEGFRALADPTADDERQRMGEAGRQWVEASLSWSALAEQLVHWPEPSSFGSLVHGRPQINASRSAVMPRPVRRLLVVNSFAVEAAPSGGQLRMQGLYTALSRYLTVHLLDLGHPQTARALRQHTTGFIEETFPMPSELCRQEAEYMRQLGVSCLDLLVALRPELLPEFSAALARYLRDCDAVVFSHPYCFPVYESLIQKEPSLARPIVYEAHNVESHLKAAMYAKGSTLASASTHAVQALEVRLLKASRWVVACSDQDRVDLQQIARDQGLGEKPVAVASNGLDTSEARYQPWSARQQSLRLSGLGIALFMASRHAPNQQALRAIVSAAQFLHDSRPDSVWRFVVLGSVGHDLRAADLPPNVHVAGVVSHQEKALWLARATVGLNPILAGSGTNLKMAEYAAWGLPILSTPFGARGGIWTDAHYLVVQASDQNHLADSLVAALDDFLARDEQQLEQQVEAARLLSTVAFDWSVGALHYLRALA